MPFSWLEAKYSLPTIEKEEERRDKKIFHEQKVWCEFGGRCHSHKNAWKLARGRAECFNDTECEHLSDDAVRRPSLLCVCTHRATKMFNNLSIEDWFFPHSELSTRLLAAHFPFVPVEEIRSGKRRLAVWKILARYLHTQYHSVDSCVELDLRRVCRTISAMNNWIKIEKERFCEKNKS